MLPVKMADKADTSEPGLSGDITKLSVPSTSHHKEQSVPSTSQHMEQSGPSTSHHTKQSAPSTSHHMKQSAPSTSHHMKQSAPSTSQHMEQSAPSTSHHMEQSAPSTSQHMEQSASSTLQHMEQSAPSTSQYMEHSAPNTLQHMEQSAPSTSQYMEQSAPSTSHHMKQSAPSTLHHIKQSAPSTSQHMEQSAPSSSQHMEQSAPSTSQHMEQSAPGTSQYMEQSAPSTSQHMEQSAPSTSSYLKNTHFTSLHYAVLRQNISDLEKLLNDAIDVNATDKYGCTPLHYAVLNREAPVVKLLLESGVNINASDRGNDFSIIKSLINKGANVAHVDAYGDTPLHLAAASGRTDVVELLLDAGADINTPNADGDAALHLAVTKKHMSTIELLLDREADVNIKGQKEQTPLFFSLDSNDESMINLLLNFGADITAKEEYGNTPLHLATWGSSPVVVELLLACGADPNMTNTDQYTSLHVAASRGDATKVTLLLDYGANVNVYENNRLTPLCHAVINGHLQVVEILLLKGTHVNTTNNNGESPLFQAVKHSKFSVLQSLLNRGADANISNRDNIAPLHLAADNNDFCFAKQLITCGADVNAADCNGDTPLHRATRSDNVNVMELLLLNGAVNMKNKSGHSSMICAMFCKDPNVIELLLRFYNSDDNIVTEALHVAAYSGHHLLTQSLVAKGADVNIRMNALANHSILHFVIGTHLTDVSIIELLIGSGADIDAFDNNRNTPLHKAAFCCKASTVELLLKKGANTNKENKDNCSPLHLAISRGDTAIVTLLLDSGADINLVEKEGRTPLCRAVIKKHKSVVELLLNRGAELDIKNVDGDTVLHLMAQQGSTDIASLLLAFKPNVNMCNRKGETPLFVASDRNYLSFIELLLSHDADVNLVNNDGYTPLHAAALRGYNSVAEILLNAGADIDAINEFGNTPLHLAVKNGQFSTVELLLNKNVNINIMNHFGDTPLHWSAQYGHEAILELLLKYDANWRLNSVIEASILENITDGPSPDYGKPHKDTDTLHKCGHTPLVSAIWSGNELIVRKIIELGVDINVADVFGTSPLHYATLYGYELIVEMLLKAGANVNTVNKHQNTPLHFAVFGKNKSICDLLLKSGANIDVADKNKNTILHLVFGRENNTHSKIYKDIEKTYESNSDKILHFALLETLLANYLISMGARVNAANRFGNTPLHMAIMINNIPSVELLLNNGADVHRANVGGFTPLHFSAGKGATYIVELLLSLGADVNTLSNDGHTPLYHACEFKKVSTVRLLLEKNAEVNKVSTSYVPLKAALKIMDIEIASMLLESGADVHRRDKFGDTPLHTAAFTGDIQLVELLFLHGGGTDVIQKNYLGETPLTITKLYHHDKCCKQVVDLLRAAEMSLIEHNPQSFNASHVSTTSQCPTEIQLANYNLLDTDKPELRYLKKNDTSGLCGQLYETKLLCEVLLRALNAEQIEHFLLGSNMAGVGDMDDICIRYCVRGQQAPVMLFVQAKHREDAEKGRLSERDLLSATGDFSLGKYFESYLAIKERFQAETRDLMFEGHFDDVECNLVMYTPAKADLARKKTGRKPSEMVEFLINTGQNVEPFQYDYDEDRVECLSKIPVIKRLKVLAVVFLEMIMSKKYKPDTILTDKRIARYHVVMARQVLQVKQENADHRVWQFRPEFLSQTNCEYLVELKNTFVREILTKRCDQSDIKNEDRDTIQQLVSSETICAATLSKLIGKLITYNKENKRLQLIEVAAFTKKYKRNELQKLVDQINKLVVSETILREAVKIKLLEMEIKLPLMFGNLDMTFRGSKDKALKRISTVCDKLVHLLEINKDTRTVTIDEHIVGPGKTIEQGIIDINGGLGSAIGNLLVYDEDTNMLKFDLDNEMSEKAAMFLNELKDVKYKPFNEILNDYRIKVLIKDFPIISLTADVRDIKTQATTFIDHLWFFCNQAKQEEVEYISKNDIDKFYNTHNNLVGFKIDSHDIYLEAHNKLQTWWKLTSEAPYLSKRNNIFESAKLVCTNKLLVTAISYINDCEISRIDVKLNSERPTVVNTFTDVLRKLQSTFNSKHSNEINDDILNLLANEYNEWKNIANDGENIAILHTEHQNSSLTVFKKRSGTSSVQGHAYKNILVGLTLVRSLNDPQVHDFILQNNIKGIGSLDDICLRYELKRRRRPIGLFVHVKHRDDIEKGKITVEELRGTTGDFSLQIFFVSYLLIKERYRVNSFNRLFEGEYDDIDCHFVIYTSVKDSVSKKKAGNDIHDRIHYLMQTKSTTTDVFQYEYNEIDVNNLTCITLKEKLKKLAKEFGHLIMVNNEIDVGNFFANEIIATYHVVLRREVVHKSKENKNFNVWKFQPDFFNEGYGCLVTFRDILVKEIYSNRYDLSEITEPDQNNLISFLDNPCATTLSHIISKVVVYNGQTKKLVLVDDPVLKYYANEPLEEQLNKIIKECDITVIKEAVEIKLLSIEIKLPSVFGNVDIFQGEKGVNLEFKIECLVENLINLLKMFKETKVITLNNNIIGEENIHNELIAAIGSAVGNLLILDTDTKTLKFDVINESLPHNAAIFLNKIKNHERYHIIEPLEQFQIKVDIKGFPKYSFDATEYDKREARDFLNKLWFYTNQAKEDRVESIFKEEIIKYYCNKINVNNRIDLHSNYLSSRARDYLQKWSMQTMESPYLSRLSDLFERAKLSDIYNILLSVINYLYVQKIYSVDIKFCQRVNQVDNFKKLWRIFIQMSVCLLKFFDPQFDQSEEINMPEEEYPRDFRELVFRLEIEPRMQYVKLLMIASAMWGPCSRCLLHTTAAPAGGRCLLRTRGTKTSNITEAIAHLNTSYIHNSFRFN